MQQCAAAGWPAISERLEGTGWKGHGLQLTETTGKGRIGNGTRRGNRCHD
jgi:hypothetical protein